MGDTNLGIALICSLNIDIFNAMLKNACATQDNNFVISVLRKMQTLTNLELNEKVVEMVQEYQKQAFQNLRTQRKSNQQTRNECFKLSREYKQWLRHFRMDKSNVTAKRSIKSTNKYPKANNSTA